jgi:hypothetical protein
MQLLANCSKGGGSSALLLVNIVLAAFALACEWAVSSITTRGCFEAEETGQNMSQHVSCFVSHYLRCVPVAGSSFFLSDNLNVRFAEISCFCVLSSSYARDGHAR